MHEINSLKNNAIKGVLWSSLDLISNQGIQFIIQIILARLLIPRDFGIIGMITVFIALSNIFVDSGFSQALIREKDISQDDYSTAFSFNLLVSVFLYFILFVSANAISNYFKEVQLVFIIRVLSLVIIINSFSIVARALLTRKINFKMQTKINIFSTISSGIIAIILAYQGYGVWSLVIRILVMQFIQSLLLWINSKWIPSCIFNIKSFKKMFNFGWKLLVSGFIDTIYNNLYYIIIGKIFSAMELGYYTNAQKLNDTVSQTVSLSVQRVSYPVLSKFQDESEKLKLVYRKIIKIAAFINFPLMIGLAVIANPLINIFFGHKWLFSVPYFQLLCFAGMMYPLHSINLDVLNVKGRSDLFLKLEILKKVIFTILIIIVLSLRLGIFALIWALVFNSYIAFFLNSYYSSELIYYSTKQQIMDIIPVLFIAIIMGILVYLSNLILPNYLFLKLIIQIFMGVYIYILMCKVAKIKELNTLYELILQQIIRKKNM